MSTALVARTVAQLWNKPIVAVNHCIGRILFCNLFFLFYLNNLIETVTGSCRRICDVLILLF